MTKSRTVWMVLILVFVVGGLSLAQRGRYRRHRGDDYRNGVPRWDIDEGHKHDVFTFVRVRYNSYGGWGRRGGGWRTDWPDSDLNFSLRLQQLTSLKVNPNPISLELTDPEVFDYPFLYMLEPGSLHFEDAEVQALRRYCLNGGFLMVDDFWGEYEWMNFYQQIKRVFPERDYEELKLDHELFHCVYDLTEKPQIPSINVARWGRHDGITWEHRESRTDTPHYRVIKDDDDRIMVLICHNTDLGDGWEREGENEWYFREFSVKKAYPMGINIVTYAMTH